MKHVIVNQRQLLDRDEFLVASRVAGKVGAPRVSGIGNMNMSKPSARSKAKNIEKYRTQDRNRAARNYKQRSAWLRALKARHGCAVCGQTFHAALDFHHVDPATKSGTIGSNVCRSMDWLVAEMSKCVLLCKNCHYKVEHGALSVSGLPTVDATAIAVTDDHMEGAA